MSVVMRLEMCFIFFFVVLILICESKSITKSINTQEIIIIFTNFAAILIIFLVK